MKETKLLKFMIMTFFMLLVIGCQDNNEPELLFNDTPAVRLKKAKKELSTLLQSSKTGWKTTYFTDNKQLGGFTFLFNFISDEEVRMHSDFGNADPTKISLYDLSLGSTLKLTFTTKNVIHELSDGNNYPDAALTGSGYKGDFEFLYYGQEGEELVFRVNRNTSIYLRFKKASTQDWVDLIPKNKISIGQIKNKPTKAVFRTLKINTKEYNFSYNENRRFATNTDGTTNVNFGVGFTSGGIIIDPALTINGVKVNTFTYDITADKYIAKANNAEVASIYYADTPAIPLLGYKDITKSNLRYNELAGLSSSNVAFLSFLSSFRTTLAPLGITLDRIYFRDINKPLGGSVQLYITINKQPNIIWFDFTKKVENNKLFFTKATGTNAPAALTQTFKPILDILFDPKGHFVENTGQLGNFSNGTFKFVPASNTTYRIHFFDF